MFSNKKLFSLLLVLAIMIAMVPAASATTVARTVDVITFNDFHGNLAEDVNSWGKNLGMSKFVSKVNEMKAANPDSFVVSGGDNYQGTAMSNLTYGEPVSEMFKALDVKVSAIGNHEFDWGTDRIAKWAEDGEFDYLASNIYDTTTNEPVTWAKPYVIIEKGGINVGLIGLAHPDTVTLTKVENVTGLEFRDPIIAAQEWIDFLKAGNAPEGTPDVIIAVTHLDSKADYDTGVLSGTAVELANGVTGLDAIVSAHSHQKVEGDVNGVAIIQAYKYARSVGKLEIQLDSEDNVIDVIAELDNAYNTKGDLIPDAEAEAVYNEYYEKLSPILNEKVGIANGEFTHNRDSANVSILGQWVCEVMADKAGTDIGIQNGGGLRRTLLDGNITMGDMYEIMPYDNTLVKFELPGKDLKLVIDHGIMNPDITDGSYSGLKVVYDPNAEFENRLVDLTLADGTPIEDEKLYSVVANDFMFTGGDKYDFSNAINDVDTYVPIRDSLVEAIRAAGTITPDEVTSMSALDNYTIVSGDMLWKIAKTHGTTYQTLAKYNDLADANLIFAGNTLLVPSK
ncbi:5'-nucleotidase C-terminal domain-containing protein [Clostridiaceae bacterium HSG29]|nr:5'-nucleotidase C-terminal domain-containing protein [Clostridiaceae bacterium HSG29]